MLFDDDQMHDQQDRFNGGSEDFYGKKNSSNPFEMYYYDRTDNLMLST
jgi:hypothetical protein